MKVYTVTTNHDGLLGIFGNAEVALKRGYLAAHKTYCRSGNKCKLDTLRKNLTTSRIYSKDEYIEIQIESHEVI